MKILFLCVANSARSQMAEGLARSLFKGSVQILSASSKPSFVHPLTIKVIQEFSIDIASQSSKSVTAINLDTIDRVITLCADEVWPYVTTEVVKEHWPLPDPANASESEDVQIEHFRRVRDDLTQRIKMLQKTISTDKKI